MARRAKIEGKTRSDIIREFLGTHPGAGPRTVVKALKEQGVEVSEGLVSQVKYLKQPEEVTISADHLIKLKQLARELGGLVKLREAINKLEEVERVG